MKYIVYDKTKQKFFDDDGHSQKTLNDAVIHTILSYARDDQKVLSRERPKSEIVIYRLDFSTSGNFTTVEIK